jgi:hypothetical protein
MGSAQAVLGDHQRDFARRGVGLVGVGDQCHAVLAVEVAGAVVEHVGQIAQFALGVGGGRLGGRFARQPRARRGTRGDQLFDGVAA